MYLNWIFKYKSLGKNCIEYAFISKVKNAQIILNEESIKYKWCNLNELTSLIQWYGDKKVLNEVLKQALENKRFFKEEKIEEFE